MNKKHLLQYSIYFVLLFPLWMWLFWFLTPKTKLVVAIIDKTVLDKGGQEHVSLNWILNNQRFAKTSNDLYHISSDYYGFFPGENEKFRTKGLERFSTDQLKQLSSDADLVYFTDTYGIYKQEWYSQKDGTERSGILYGGLSDQDVELLRNMKAKHKLIITEFNTIGSPTSVDNRDKFEKLFAMHWTGWTGRYFDNLDTNKNKELPRWLIHDYKKQHNRVWPFHKAGLAFVSNHDQVVILEDCTHLTDPVPDIITMGYGQKKLSLPAKMKYPFWFDVITPDLSVNHAVSRFDLNLNANGAAELKKYNIPATFPAIIMHKDKDYQFYYFSGDFCDNPIGMGSSYFAGIGFFKGLFYNSDDPSERKRFFWEFYKPMITSILEDNVTGKK
ncbi:MAG TPA: hypothetical protein VGN20_18115 [Mucilaginibacter sp.]|jgi:hypothetical protein